jgi:ribose transport system permease protein
VSLPRGRLFVPRGRLRRYRLDWYTKTLPIEEESQLMAEVRNKGGCVAGFRHGLPSALAAAGAYLRRLGILAQFLSLAIVVAFFAIGTGGRFLYWENVQLILSLAAIPAIFAIGLYGTVVLGGIDLSIPGVASLCAVFVGLLLRNAHNANDVGLWIIPIAVAIGAVAGAANGMLHTKLRIPSFITTLAMGWILYGFSIFLGRAVNVQILDTRIGAFVTAELFGIPQVAVLAFLLVIAAQVVESRTQFGRYMYAIGGDEVLARQAGIRVRAVKVAVFTIAGAVYGIASLLWACRLGIATSRMGLDVLFPTITAVVVGGVALTGGIGGAKNAALGALIVTALDIGLIQMHVNPYVQDAVTGIVLIIAVALTLDRKKLGFIK